MILGNAILNFLRRSVTLALYLTASKYTTSQKNIHHAIFLQRQR